MAVPPPAWHGPDQQAGRPERANPASLTDEQLSGCVMSPLARCAVTAIDPDEWFPVATTVAAARAEAAHALALCVVCPVRAECLELSLRHWRAVGRYGIWGGLVEAERAAVRREWLAGTEVTTLLEPVMPSSDLGDQPALAAGRRLGQARARRRSRALPARRRQPRRTPGGTRQGGGAAGAAPSRRRPFVHGDAGQLDS
jgi:Transcription factor WhiB